MFRLFRLFPNKHTHTHAKKHAPTHAYTVVPVVPVNATPDDADDGTEEPELDPETEERSAFLHAKVPVMLRVEEGEG